MTVPIFLPNSLRNSMLLTGWKKESSGRPVKGKPSFLKAVKKAAKKKAEKTWRVIKERRSKNADRTAEQSRNSGTQGNSQTERQTDIRIKTKEAVNKRTAGVARENIAEVKNATPLRDSANRTNKHIQRKLKGSVKIKETGRTCLPFWKKISCPREKGCNTICKGS